MVISVDISTPARVPVHLHCFSFEHDANPIIAKTAIAKITFFILLCFNWVSYCSRLYCRQFLFQRILLSSRLARIPVSLPPGCCTTLSPWSSPCQSYLVPLWQCIGKSSPCCTRRRIWLSVKMSSIRLSSSWKYVVYRCKYRDLFFNRHKKSRQSRLFLLCVFIISWWNCVLW